MSKATGKEAKIQFKGTSGSFNVLGDASSVDFSVEPSLQETTSFDDEATSRIPGLIGASLSVEYYPDDTDPTVQSDLRSAALNGDTVEVEYSPDDNASSKQVYAFIVLVSNFSPPAEIDSANTISVDMEISDGNVPTVGSTFT